MARRKYSYYGCGLHIFSDIALPFVETQPAQPPDVRLAFGKMPDDIAWERKISSYSISHDAFLLTFKNMKLFAGSGRQIIIEGPENDAFIPDDAVPFILSSCMGALLHQRNSLAFHASSVMTKRGAAVFIGGSSSGKSTLAAVLERKGYGVLSDDICPVDLTDGSAVMVPSGQNLLIWKDIVNSLKIPAKWVQKIRPSIEKYYYVVDRDFTKPVKISVIYLLNGSNEGLYQIDNGFSGNQKLNILKSNIYMKNLAKEMCVEHQYYQRLKQLALTVPVKEFTKPNSEFKPGKLTDILEEDFTR